jgi:YggT family protein
MLGLVQGIYESPVHQIGVARTGERIFMFVLANFVDALAAIVNILLTIMYWLVLIRALISWVNPDPYNPIVQFLMRTTEPLLEPIRRMLPPMGIDISPIIVFFIIVFLQKFLVGSLYDFAERLR